VFLKGSATEWIKAGVEAGWRLVRVAHLDPDAEVAAGLYCARRRLAAAS